MLTVGPRAHKRVRGHVGGENAHLWRICGVGVVYAVKVAKERV